MRLPAARQGERVYVNGKLIEYGYWPTRKGPKGNASLQSMLFTLDPWAIIDLSVKRDCPSSAQAEAIACLRQARDFYESATEVGRPSAKPLSLYYCLLNLVKAFCLTRGTRTTFDRAQHGLSEALRGPGNHELTDAYLQAFPSPGSQGRFQIFSEFRNALVGSQLPAQQDFDLPVLLPQVVPGHRLWAFAANKRERFVAIHAIHPLRNRASSEMWLNLYFVGDDLSRMGITKADFIAESGLAGSYAQVACQLRDVHGRALLCFQQVHPHSLASSKVANSLQQLFDSLKPCTWTTVAATPPYRRYYVYLRPAAEAGQVVHQLLSIYALSYYLGSITRYRPHHFPSITDSNFGPRVQEFVSGQPLQFLYLMASEFSRRDIARPSIV